MKRQWVSPEAKVQEFVANEYVAACATCDVAWDPKNFYKDENKNGNYDNGEKDWTPGFGIPDQACGAHITKEFEEGDGFTTTIIRRKSDNVRVYLWCKNDYSEYHLSTGSENAS